MVVEVIIIASIDRPDSYAEGTGGDAQGVFLEGASGSQKNTYRHQKPDMRGACPSRAIINSQWGQWQTPSGRAWVLPTPPNITFSLWEPRTVGNRRHFTSFHIESTP